MTIYLSAAVAIVGLLMYVLSASVKVQEIGRISFFTGLLVFLLHFAGWPHIVNG